MTDTSHASAGPETGDSVDTSLPGVQIVLASVDGADTAAALASIRRQAYAGPTAITVVGEGDHGEDVTGAADLEEAISGAPSQHDYLWIIHADARPRPDALAALVREVERNEAGLGASKLLKAEPGDVLEAIGSATDVFGEPYTGLDEAEIDLQQYDVVREVSYVTSVSMLVRRDLARGLGGLDTKLPPDAAGLDFSQRARLAGARVIIVPSSEVYHQGRCRAQEGWRERAGRLRALLIAYRPLTLAWVIPVSLLVGLLDGILNLFLGRWKHLASYFATWGWNVVHLPSTWAARRRANSIRSVGDEELFRFQTSGSVRLRTVGDEISARILQMFDEDQPMAKGAKRVWSSPGIVGAVIAGVVVLASIRSVVISGVPNTGFSFPFEPPSVGFQRILGGWNDSGLGSPVPVHPVVAFTSVVGFLWFGAEHAARVVITIGAGFLGIVGMGRLLGRLGLRGPGRYLAGLVAVAGPGTALLTGAGSWSALIASAILPWAIRSVYVHPAEADKHILSKLGWAVVLGWVLAAVSPVLVVVPALALIFSRAQQGRRARILLALGTLAGAAAAANFVLGDPGWILDPGRRLGLTVAVIWPGLILLAALPLFFEEIRYRRVAGVGAILGLGALLLANLGVGGPGAEEAGLVLVSVGAAIVVGVALDRVSLQFLPIVSSLAALAMLVLSAASLLGGTMGLTAGDLNDELSFARSLAQDGSPRRVLYVSTDRSRVPGEARPGPGVWYRVLDGAGTTIDDVWLAPERSGDTALDGVVTDISTGGVLRPGRDLAPFAIGWVVLVGEENAIDSALTTQLDAVPVPFDTEMRVYENEAALPIAVTAGGEPWLREGLDWVGTPTHERVELALNYTSGWVPEGQSSGWATSVSGVSGRVGYQGHPTNTMLGWVSLAVLVAGLVLVPIGRLKS